MNQIKPAKLNGLVDEFLAEAQDDLVGLWEVVRSLERQTNTPEILREQTLEVVRVLLARGLLAGDPPYSAGGYRPWANQRPDEVVDRIRSEWIALGRAPNIPDIAWFSRPDRV